MTRTLHFMTGTVSALLLTAGMAIAGGGHGNDDAAYCMDVRIDPFHMMPGFMTEEGACAVRDYWDGALQEAYYPFTIEDHLFNCDYFKDVEEFGYGDFAPLPTGDMVPSSVVSQGNIIGTIGGHPFEAKLMCASQTNWYQDSCEDPEDPSTCAVQLAQPVIGLREMLSEEHQIEIDLYPRVTEVSVFDGAITVGKGKKAIPIVIATRAAGITHIEELDPPLVGASITHSLLGMVTYDEDDEVDDVKVLEGSADMLLQGHIFFDGTVEEDPGAARIYGAICSEDLYNLLNKGKKEKKGKDKDDD